MSNLCRDCKAPVVWAKMVKDGQETGKTGIIDAEPVAKGNIMLYQENGLWRATVLTGLELDAFRLAGGNLHLSHFATCAFAKKWRNK